jgi:hypothetical protein
VILVAFKAIDSVLCGQNGGFDSHTPPPQKAAVSVMPVAGYDPRRKSWCISVQELFGAIHPVLRPLGRMRITPADFGASEGREPCPLAAVLPHDLRQIP